MAGKISDLTALTGAGTASNDKMEIDDVSATTSKSITIAELGTALAGNTTVFVPTAGGTLAEAANLALGTTTGTKIGTATSQKLGFFNATPVVQPSALTQTYATAEATLDALTAAALTDSSGGSSGGGTIAAIGGAVDPTAALKTATANAVATLAAMVNKNTADHADLAQFVNSLVDKLQALGLMS